MNTFAELKELLGDSYSELIDAFNIDNRQILMDAKLYAEKLDYDELSKCAHSLKGASSHLDAEELTRLCESLEQQSKSGHVDNLVGLMQSIELEFEKTVERMKSA